MPAAELIYADKQLFEDGTIIDIRIWLLSTPLPPSRHAFKYSFFYGHPGTRLVLFDNERGKGDHKHIREVESAYEFRDIETLTKDFLAAMRAVRSENEA